MNAMERNHIGTGTSLVVQWLRLSALNTVGPGLIPGQGTRSHMPQQQKQKKESYRNRANLRDRSSPEKQAAVKA